MDRHNAKTRQRTELLHFLREIGFSSAQHSSGQKKRTDHLGA
jgi:hypothetical protein